jgi:hypothetical protein
MTSSPSFLNRLSIGPLAVQIVAVSSSSLKLITVSRSLLGPLGVIGYSCFFLSFEAHFATLPQKLSKHSPFCLGLFCEKPMSIHAIAFAFWSAAARAVKSTNGPTVHGGCHARLSCSL